MRKNQIIERLKQSPCTNDDLPQRVSISGMSAYNQQLIRRISVAGCRSRQTKLGQLRVVYYIAGDETAAIKLFADRNAKALDKINFSRNTPLDSSLPPGMAQRLRAILRIARNIESHSSAIKDLGTGVRDLNGMLEQLKEAK